MNSISAISLLAYDYELMLSSLPRYIDLVDEVILGLDKKRLTWAGNSFEIPEHFFVELKNLDSNNIIKIVEDDFFVEGQNAADLDTRERNILSKHAREGSWLVSVDADEIMFNIDELIAFLRSFSDENVCIFGNWMTLFKQNETHLFVIENDLQSVERFPLATKKPDAFTYCRNTKQRFVPSSACALHYSWARTRDEVERKMLNWSHKDDFVVEDFLARWDSLNESNAHEFVDFHPFEKTMWKKLVVVAKSELENYARSKANEFNAAQSWAGVAAQARVGLLEEKIIKRDADAAAAKLEAEKTIAELKGLQHIEQASSGFLGGLFKAKGK